MFGAALRLGLTSFGGPTAHIGYFREAYVDRRRWLDGDDFGDLVALVQFLPGPASSQLGVAIGMLRAGPLGGLAAWVGFTLPSAAALIAFAYGVGGADTSADGWVPGLELAAVAVVALAVWQMAWGLATGVVRGAVAVGAAAVMLAWGGTLAQVLVIVAGGLVGWRLLDAGTGAATRPPLDFGVPRRVAVAALVLAVALLGALPLAREATGSHAVALSSEMYQSGALVFGGGHVVLPLLHERTVTPGWVSESDFLAGYGAAQAVPGPLFTFAGYLGAVQGPEPNGVTGGTIAIAAIFLPGLLLVVGTAPFWTLLRARPVTSAVLAGVNAAVVGLLFAALCRPLVSTAVTDAADVGVALAALGLLVVARVPPWAVVALCAAAGQLLL